MGEPNSASEASHRKIAHQLQRSLDGKRSTDRDTRLHGGVARLVESTARGAPRGALPDDCGVGLILAGAHKGPGHAWTASLCSPTRSTREVSGAIRVERRSEHSFILS